MNIDFNQFFLIYFSKLITRHFLNYLDSFGHTLFRKSLFAPLFELIRTELLLERFFKNNQCEYLLAPDRVLQAYHSHIVNQIMAQQFFLYVQSTNFITTTFDHVH
ncbi:hypothetical protein BpHYR1_023903 [Brachionus plicatilis]|uniref:Uncharacterized protein n=1 Tax=Brachionus plicatilis TaxID=10195 RepID=A0A3M7R5E8_BRAPC|nr:hypothetical protein BpHYR1_023903 [Brachionus plicatilis]